MLGSGAKAFTPEFGFTIETMKRDAEFALSGLNHLLEMPTLVQWLFKELC